MSIIRDIEAAEIRDSRDRPTLRVSVKTDAGTGSFDVPSGASVGSGEAVELRDENGGMQRAIGVIAETIKPALVGMDALDQRALDTKMLELDGTAQKEKLGGNSMIGVSIAAARAAAEGKSAPLHEYLRSLAGVAPSRPVPYLYANYINGGKHADSPIAFQEHMLVPEAANAREALAMLEKIGGALERVIAAKYGADAAAHMGDEGGFVIPESDPAAPLELLTEACAEAGCEGRVRYALDAAATSFFADGRYTVGGKSLAPQELHALYAQLAARFPILSIEDPFEERALADTAALQKALPGVRVVGDDLTVTNAARITEAAQAGAIKAVIIKPNQAGTLSETLDAIRAAREAGIECIVSHRSGETMDPFVADLAFAIGAFGLKAGAPRKPERRVKYERLIEISQ